MAGMEDRQVETKEIKYIFDRNQQTNEPIRNKETLNK